MFQISIKGWSLARTAGLGWCHLLELDIAAHGCSVPIQVKWRDMAIIRHDSASAASLASSAGDGRTAHTGSPPTNKMVGEFPRQVEGSTLRGAAAGHVWISPLVDDSHDVMKTWKQCESHRACAWHWT